MNRRTFISLLGGAAAVWPRAARAQQAAMPAIGFIRSSSPANSGHLVNAFRQGLSETGFVDGQNLSVEYRWMEDQVDRLPALMADLVQRRVAVLVATGGSAVVRAAKAATATIPIVFTSGEDPVALGLVASLNRPGGNATGVSLLTMGLGQKRLGLLRELVPAVTSIAVLEDPNFPNFEAHWQDVEAAAHALGLQVVTTGAGTERDFEPMFATLAQQRVGALLVGPYPFFTSHRVRLVELAARHRIPTMYQLREFALAGGLMSYGTSLTEAYRQAGGYAGRILKGTKPTELPVIQPTKFELVLNLKTAKALGLEFPPTLLVSADEVIE